ncbi:MAG TPA: glucosamine-6-phosphate deaminase [Chryseolinea sp.]
MDIVISRDVKEMGKEAGISAGRAIRNAISERGIANIILATGTSQFETLNQLIAEEGIEWSKVVMFHLDEYIGLPITHPASFRKYLKERFIARVPPLKAAFLIDGEADPVSECERLSKLISNHPIDVALVGIGENGHLAFNDPPADFETEKPYLVVNLDDQCVQQQFGEGWFPSIDDVPRKAISMSVRQIMRSNQIICSVPDSRKAVAVKNSVENPVSNLYPASILQQHPHCTIFLDPSSASLLTRGIMA